MFQPLNWLELEILLQKIRKEVVGLFLERIFIPERPKFQEGFLKSEWGLRLSSRKEERALLFSVRARHPYLALYSKKGPRASQQAPHSAFDLALSKWIKGAKMLEVSAFPKERTALIWFSDPTNTHSRLGLILTLIPTVPEALLISGLWNPEKKGWPVLARTRHLKEKTTNMGDYFTPPEGGRAPIDPKIRETLQKSSEHFTDSIESSLMTEAFEVRLTKLQKQIRDELKQATQRAKQAQVALHEATGEPDWKKYGDLLKTHLPTPPPPVNGKRLLYNYETEKEEWIPCDSKLTSKEQVGKFYHQAKRKKRRIDEAQLRLIDAESTRLRLEKILNHPPQLDEWKGLEELEQKLGIIYNYDTHHRSKKQQPHGIGKSFVSKDGLTILVGRNSNENLAITFKLARGNDCWLHVRGKPGAHVLISLPPGKSPPLETLMDAAILAVFYSGGEHWGKTEVDYTFKKYIRRIKDSTEASYTHNKTLLVEMDQERLKRLMG